MTSIDNLSVKTKNVYKVRCMTERKDEAHITSGLLDSAQHDIQLSASAFMGCIKVVLLGFRLT